MTRWVDVKGDFDDDGFYREIHVLDAKQSDWQRVLAALPTSAWRWVYKYDDKVTALPTSFSTSLQEQGSPYLVVDPEGLQLRCTFLQEDDLEFFLNTKAVQNEQAFERLLDFMRWVSKLVGKPVVVLHELAAGTPALAIFSVTSEY